MKKLTRISLVVVLIFTLVVGALLITGHAGELAGQPSCQKVGWNDRAMPCGTAFIQLSTIQIKPMVGWNN